MILFPALLIGTFLAVQGILFYMANTAVTNAAQIGLETARAQSSSAASGQSAAASYMAQQSVLSNESVNVSRGGDTVTVTARGTAPTMLPFDLPEVSSHISGPVEKVIAP